MEESISRKKFLRAVGSIITGGAIAGVSGTIISKYQPKDGLTPVLAGKQPENGGFASPYKPIVVFTSPGSIEAFEQHDDKLYVVTENKLTAMDDYGKTLLRFGVKEGLTRDMAVDADEIYLLRPASVLVYSHSGELLREWDACSELSNYCSLTLAENFVFVTDKDNKNICKYTREGTFVKFINSPNRFIIPSLTFGIAYANGKLYCSNSGRHQVEIYSIDGEYEGKFGSAGGQQGYFCGCCNPVYLTCTPTGEIITSEKGNPRVSCYGNDGKFRSLLLNSKMLDEGSAAASKVKIAGGKLFTAGKDKVRVYEYDPQLAAAAGACGGCGVNCGLRKG
ncbi:MAG: hypothetical protein LBK18_07040 [Prevotellaceae bacterium]|jgi:hypothetical protein|nr:hypothetical protein [Prevotellaceae bacterium]